MRRAKERRMGRAKERRMHMGLELARQLDGARYVRVDEERGAVLAWFGGHRCRAYTPEGTEFAYWDVGDFAHNAPSLEEVQENFDEHIRTGEYVELY
jgi:hypothetical protein